MLSTNEKRAADFLRLSEAVKAIQRGITCQDESALAQVRCYQQPLPGAGLIALRHLRQRHGTADSHPPKHGLAGAASMVMEVIWTAGPKVFCLPGRGS
jgi:hypothetical protein